MDRATLLSMLRDSGISSPGGYPEHILAGLHVFSERVAAHEREACAKLCEHVAEDAVTDEIVKSDEYERQLNMTVGQNIDRQIATVESELLRLRGIKKNLEDSGLLKLKIMDLRQAMQELRQAMQI